MQITEPEVFLIAKPQIDGEAIYKYLNKIDPAALEWANRITESSVSDGEALVEFGGRLCYRSWAEGLNANVTRVRKDSEAYFENILKSKHGSVLEHANYSFVFHNVSRVFTHELVRHRAGTAISQESLRFVRLTHLGFRIPEVLNPVKNQIVEIVELLEDFQVNSAEELKLNEDHLPFHIKKEVTSALRRLAPLGLSTGMLWTANIRTLRHVIESRTAPGAEEEICLVFDQVGRIMKEQCPFLFDDMEPNLNGAWIPKYSKV